jgi:phytol kinase
MTSWDHGGVYINMQRSAIGPGVEILPQSILSRVLELRGEVVRKTLHALIAAVPAIAAVTGVASALGMLGLGVLVYTGAEYARLQGRPILVISRLTVIASRPRDFGHFVVGPVTLGIGAMLALLLYPAPAAFLAIYALAFGDGVASLVGRLFGRIRITNGTTVEGSLSCLVAVFVTAIVLTRNVPISLTIAVAATFLEAVASDDMDNIIVPVGVGLLATILLA